MSERSAPRLSEAIGQNLRRLRDESGYSANDLALRARKVGLAWTRPIVANIETGRRGEITLAEFLLLPLLLSTTDRPVRVEDLLDGVELVSVTGAGSESVCASPSAIRTVLDGSDDYTQGWTFPGLPNAVSRVRQTMERAQAMLPPDATGPDVTTALDEAKGEVERQIARRLDASPVQVAFAGHRRWGRSVHEERDARVTDRLRSGDSAGSLRGVRGHVTRELIEELSEDLESYPRDGGGEESR